MTDMNRFMRFVAVDVDGCWIWQGHTDRDGYGNFRFNGKGFRAHRASLILFGVEVPNDKFVCHHCDRPSCVNPKHLYVGTCKSNSDDKIRRNRTNWARGEKQGSSKLTKEQVIKIRQQFATGEYHHSELAEQYGVSKGLISLITCGIIWRHI